MKHEHLCSSTDKVQGRFRATKFSRNIARVQAGTFGEGRWDRFGEGRLERIRKHFGKGFENVLGTFREERRECFKIILT